MFGVTTYAMTGTCAAAAPTAPTRRQMNQGALLYKGQKRRANTNFDGGGQASQQSDTTPQGAFRLVLGKARKITESAPISHQKALEKILRERRQSQGL